MKTFNTVGACVPSKHYMVDLSERIDKIKAMVDQGRYFTINRPRQYGKTTTISALDRALSPDNVVIILDFQKIGARKFATSGTFSQTLSQIILDASVLIGLTIPDPITKMFEELTKKKAKEIGLYDLFRVFMFWIAAEERPIVLVIDEVDSATNNQVFLEFLAQLRSQYLSRNLNPLSPAFQSVILSGVTDVRHIKSKVRKNDSEVLNSPWNIAVDFDLDMSLSKDGIKVMLDEYENDHHTGMDTDLAATEIREWTRGYPFLVSALCELIDTKVSNKMTPRDAWTKAGVSEAARMLLAGTCTLFDSITRELNDHPDLNEIVRAMLMEGKTYSWHNYQKNVARLNMYGIVHENAGQVAIDNRIFEKLLYDVYLTDEEHVSAISEKAHDSKNKFVVGGRLNMRMVMDGFIKSFHEVFGPLDERFDEERGREQFLLYLKPIINGTGNFYIEAQTRDKRRMDVVVDYRGERHVVELKIWRGERYNAKGEQQISDYLDYFGLSVGYLLSFNFNKKKETGVRRIAVGDKVLFEGTV